MTVPQPAPLRRRPSIMDVALEAGVSRAAVSKVIRNAYGVSPAMRTRVETAIAELGYRPRVAARAMRGASFTIGFEIPQLGNEFFTQIMQGAAAGLVGSAYQLIVGPGFGPSTGSAVLESLVDRQVDGLLAISSEVTAEWLSQLAQTVPMVLIGRHDESEHYDSVNADDAAGVDLVMDHLFALGHRRIAHLTITPPTELSPHALRLRRYEDRMRQAGLEPHVCYSATFEPDAYEAARELLDALDRPTAIFAGHDTMAIGVLRALADLHLDFSDVSVAGYDDIDLAGHPAISLTTVHQFGVDMGAAAVRLLMERVQHGRQVPVRRTFVPRLQVRQSTRPV